MRVALVGAPGSGKSTVACDALADLREQGVGAELVPEFAREYIVANGGIRTEYEQAFMASEQARRESTLAMKEGLVVISDGSPLHNVVYAAMLASKAGSLRKPGAGGLMLEILYKGFLDSLKENDVIAFVQKPLVPRCHADGVRIHGEAECDRIQAYLEAFLGMHGGPDLVLAGPRERRRADLVEYILRVRGAQA